MLLDARLQLQSPNHFCGGVGELARLLLCAVFGFSCLCYCVGGHVVVELAGRCLWVVQVG